MAFSVGHVLLINGNASLAKLAAAAAMTTHCQLTTVTGLKPALSLVAKKQFDLILVDASSLGDEDLKHLLAIDLTRQGRIVIEGGSGANPKNGSPEYLTEPLSLDGLLSRMSQAALRTPSREIPADGEFGGMVGRTLRMQALFEYIRRVAPLEVGVLVHGESGTGKELVARALHQVSGRTGKFVAVNCGAVSPELLSSQLFGHERGSFTGATQSHAGYFEQAQGGTLFLDEITEMPRALQVYLLRVIETHSLTRVGGSREIPFDVRVIAASNRNLQYAVAAGDLRSDLYFRLLEFPLMIPPLRERREDVPLLAQYFLDQLNERYGTKKLLTADAMDALIKRPWPGNVRELLHTVRREYIMASDAEAIDIGADSEPVLYRRAGDAGQPNGTWPEGPTPRARDGHEIRFSIGTTLEEIEREVLLKTLAHFHNNKREAARALGVSLKTIYNKLLRYRSQGLITADVFDDPPENNGRAA